MGAHRADSGADSGPDGLLVLLIVCSCHVCDEHAGPRRPASRLQLPLYKAAERCVYRNT